MNSEKKNQNIDDEMDPLEGPTTSGQSSEGPAPSGSLSEEPDSVEEAQTSAQLLERLMRLQAEYENYRKRAAREKVQWTGRAVEGLVLDLLPALDSFDRALESARESTDAKAILEGMELVMRQLLDALAQNGVKPVDAKGEPFDPNHHEAFLSRPVEQDEAPGILVEEILKGYRMGDRTIRPTRGIVSVAPEPEADSTSSPEDE